MPSCSAEDRVVQVDGAHVQLRIFGGSRSPRER